MPELTKRERMKMDRTEIPVRDASERIADFDEVRLGYTSGLAILEASRCLNCKRPVCIDGCPIGIRIDEFIKFVADGDFAEASAVIHEANPLPAVCGRVCPQELQCENACVLTNKGKPIAIGDLERFVADEERKRLLDEPVGATPSTGRKTTLRRVAIIGSGPAGLACAGDLAHSGHEVVVFEALHEPGGVLIYGIPEFRLPKAIVRAEISRLEGRGITFMTDVLVGSDTTLHELMHVEGFDAVFIGTGAGFPTFPGIPGEELIGVYSAHEFLARVNLTRTHLRRPDALAFDLAGRPTVVIGGGNTALDSARVALRLGADPVLVLYRRSEEEIPACNEEIEHSDEEGVQIRYLVAPTSFNGVNGWLKSVTIQEMRLGEPDASGRARPEPIEGAFETIEAAVAIVAIGNAPNPVLTRATPELVTTAWGTIEVDQDTGLTSIPGVFAGGDITTGGATVILALAAGRRSAAAITEYLSA